MLDLNPGEMLKATAYAALIEALRSQGKYREGNRIGLRMVDEADSNFGKTIAYYEMAYNLAEMEEDLDEALSYARRSVELSPDEIRQFPLAALGVGALQAEGVPTRRSISFPSRASWAPIGEHADAPGHGASHASGEEDRARSVLAHARGLSGRGEGLQERMMECMKDSTTRLLGAGVRRGQKR